MSPNELDLRRTLHHDAERIDATGDFAVAAIGLERRRARRRNTMAAAAAVTALAVATPIAWSNLGTDAPPTPATSSTAPVSPTPSASDTGTPPPTTEPTPADTRKPGPAPTADSDAEPQVAVTLESGPVTGTPRVAYVLDGVFHDGDRRVRLPVSTGLRGVARLANGGVLVHTATDEGVSTMRFLDASGVEVARAAAQGLAVNADGSRVAATDSKGTIRIYDAQGDQRNALRTGDENARPSGQWGDILYYVTVDEKGRTSTRSWDTTGTSTAAVVAGSFAELHEGRSLAILWPNQDYDPGNTCYGIFDLKAGAVNHWSCGEFAPTHFTADGSMVVGPNVADGPGSSNFKVASADDGAILMTVAAPDGAWSPSWRGAGSADAIVVVPVSKRDTEQTIASCSVSTGTCSSDLEAVSVSSEDSAMMRYPIMLSLN